MKTACWTLLLLLAAASVSAQVSWRFGFEYNELPPWNLPYHAVLLEKLQRVGTNGGVNVNGMGSWSAMQSGPDAAINFSESDAAVSTIQQYNLTLTWYLRCDAAWAFPSRQIGLAQTAAPDPQFENKWQDYVKAIVERYDGDGVNDMPGLQRPIEFYIMIGEVVFGKTGQGDEEKGPFWNDNIENLLRLHQLTWAAMKEADPTGFSKLVSSGALLWDMYADFPDYPEFEARDGKSTLRRRLTGENYRGGTYLAGMDSLRNMLSGLDPNSGEPLCDYIGWHPHFSWRVIDQEFRFIRKYSGNMPIYVDDMWCNLFTQGYAGGVLIPGEAQFTAQQFPPTNTDWVQAINGDFPNALFTSLDPYAELYQKLNANDDAVTAWYYANGARRAVKSFASAFGEGAERASFSQTNDLIRGFELGWINMLGTRSENFAEKPQYYTYTLLVEILNDFTGVERTPVSENPLTRVYRFERPRGDVYVCWSETGPPPPNMDYSVPNGETVTLLLGTDSARISEPITEQGQTQAPRRTLALTGGQLTIQLGYQPLFIEPIGGMSSTGDPVIAEGFDVAVAPNPFSGQTSIILTMERSANIAVTITDVLGRVIAAPYAARMETGQHTVLFTPPASAKGMMFIQIAREGRIIRNATMIGY